MKNKKGMTIIEVIISIMLVSVIIIFLLNLLITVKNFSTQNQSSSDLLINQAVIVKAVEKDMHDYELQSISTCSESDLQSTGRNRVVPLDSSGNLPSNLYCLKLTYNPSLIDNNIGYLLQYTYNYSDSGQKNVVGYKRGTNQTIRETQINMNPNDTPGIVTSSCISNPGTSTCALKIVLPVYDKLRNNYDIELSYIYNKESFSYYQGTGYGFRIE